MPGGSAHRSLEGHREGTGGEDNRQQARFSTVVMEQSPPFCSTHIVKFNARVLPRRNRNFLLKCARGSKVHAAATLAPSPLPFQLTNCAPTGSQGTSVISRRSGVVLVLLALGLAFTALPAPSGPGRQPARSAP